MDCLTRTLRVERGHGDAWMGRCAAACSSNLATQEVERFREMDRERELQDAQRQVAAQSKVAAPHPYFDFMSASARSMRAPRCRWTSCRVLIRSVCGGCPPAALHAPQQTPSRMSCRCQRETHVQSLRMLIMPFHSAILVVLACRVVFFSVYALNRFFPDCHDADTALNPGRVAAVARRR
eukprot:6212898-Pleurochrysis_carterae.AAC.4